MSEDVTPYGAQTSVAASRAEELQTLASRLGWSQREAARHFEVDTRDMRYWFSGRYAAPLMLIYAMRYLNSVEGRNAVSAERRVAE